jgi:hypothetical protein
VLRDVRGAVAVVVYVSGHPDTVNVSTVGTW